MNIVNTLILLCIIFVFECIKVNAILDGEDAEIYYKRLGYDVGEYYKYFIENYGKEDTLVTEGDLEPSVVIHRHIDAYTNMLAILNRNLEDAKVIGVEWYQTLLKLTEKDKKKWEERLRIYKQLYLPNFLYGVFLGAEDYGRHAVILHSKGDEARNFFVMLKHSRRRRRSFHAEYDTESDM